MTADISIRQATAAEADLVGDMAFRLVRELVHPAGADLDPLAYRQTAAGLMAGDGGYWALLAKTSAGEAVGVITLNECAAIYAGGRFGEIPELYVEPA